MKFSYLTGGSYQHTLLDEIRASDGRRVDFNYDNSTNFEATLKNIKAHGLTVLYEYAAAPTATTSKFLKQVRLADGTKWKYQYQPGGGAGLYSMSKIEMPGTGIINYKYKQECFYDCSGYPDRYVSSIAERKLSGRSIQTSTWSYTYAKSRTTNKTTVSFPYGRSEYYHNSPHSGTSGNVWKVGLLVEKRTYEGSSLKRRVINSWAKHKISNNPRENRGVTFLGFTAIDSNTSIAVLDKAEIIDAVSGTDNHYIKDYSNFNQYGQPEKLKESGSNSRTTTFSYQNDSSSWLVGLLKNESVSGIGTISRSYDSDGNLKSLSKYGLTTTYDYDSSGNLSYISDANSRVTTLTNHYRGIPRNETRDKNGKNLIISRVVDSLGRITSQTTAGKTYGYSYDGRNKLRSISFPKSGSPSTSISWSYSYGGTSIGSASAAISKTTRRGGKVTVESFDALGSNISTSTNGIVLNRSFDELGRLTFESYPNSSKGVVYDHDILGKIESRKNTADNSTVIYSYYSNDVVSERNERGQITNVTYSSYSPNEKYPVKIDQPSNISTVINRDAIGKVRSVVQGGLTRSYVYTPQKQLDYILDPETGKTDFTYDNVGNLRFLKVGTSGITEYRYDGLNQLTNVLYPASTTDNPTSPNIAHDYYPDGLLKSSSKGNTRWDYVYDANNNLTVEQLTNAASVYRLSYTYDALDNLSRTTYPSGLAVDYAPDALGRPTKIAGYVNSVGYHANNAIRQINFANGTTTNISQNSRLLPNSFVTTKDSATIASVGLTYDPRGNITTKNHIYSTSYTYDGLDRLYSFDGTPIRYDTRNNITAYGGIGYTYNTTNNRLSSITSGGTTFNYSYDVYGNIKDNNRVRFIYDNASNLIKNSTLTHQFEYDANNHRATEVVNGQTKHTVYSASGKLMFEQSNGESKEHIYLNNTLVAKHVSCSDLDTDLDQLSDCIERRIGTDIHIPDTDGDGMTDGFEYQHGFNPLADNGEAQQDSDNDGFSNYLESLEGTNPHDPNSKPTMAWMIPIRSLLLN